MKWGAIGLGIGAAVLLIPALAYVWLQFDSQNRRSARIYLLPGLIVLGIAVAFAVAWAIRHMA